MPDLPVRPDLDQLRHQAKDLLHAARSGDAAALARIRAVSDRLMLASAQLTVARTYGFPSWRRLKTEVSRREILNSRDVGRLTALIAEEPSLATADLAHCATIPMARRRSTTSRCCASTRSGSGCPGTCRGSGRSRRRCSMPGRR